MPDNPTQDHDLLIELRVLLKQLMEKTNENHVTNIEAHAKLDQRIGILEQWRQNLNGRITATVAIISAVVGFAIQLTMNYISKQ